MTASTNMIDIITANGVGPYAYAMHIDANGKLWTSGGAPIDKVRGSVRCKGRTYDAYQTPHDTIHIDADQLRAAMR